MPFQKGRNKTGGRKLLTRNKITRDVYAALDALGCNPLEGMARIATDPATPLPLRARMYESLIKHVHPQLKSIELTGLGGGAIKLDVTDIPAGELLERGIARIIERKRAAGNLGPDAGVPEKGPAV